MDLRWEILAPYADLFVKGTVMTVQLTVIALALGLLAGLGIGLLTAQVQTGYKKALRWLCMGYVAFFSCILP
jgi:polar amino acid transport system permease protein